MKAVIFDLDGTLADIGHRVALLPDWPSFYHACDKDKPVEAIIHLAKVLHALGHPLYILTGRSEIVREKTVHWLQSHSIPYDQILMREDDDFRTDAVLKKEMLESVLKPEDVLFIVEDRKSVVEMWRNNGFTVLQCAEGDF